MPPKSRTPKNKVYRPFAAVAEQMQTATKDKKKKERTTTTSYIRHGETVGKKTIAKPKDWAFRQPSEGRAASASVTSTRARKVRLSDEIWGASKLMWFLMDIKAGVPECRWTITMTYPQRIPTARDILYILQWLQEFYGRDEAPDIQVEVNHNHRVLTIIDPMPIKSHADTDGELGTGITNK